MSQERVASFDDLGHDLLVRIFENLPMRSRGQSEIVCKTWRELSVQAGWRHISYRYNSKAQLLAFVDWLCLRLSQRRPDAVKTIQVRGEVIGKSPFLKFRSTPSFSSVAIMLPTNMQTAVCTFMASWQVHQVTIPLHRMGDSCDQ